MAVRVLSASALSHHESGGQIEWRGKVGELMCGQDDEKYAKRDEIDSTIHTVQ